jgi:HSP20 family protein
LPGHDKESIKISFEAGKLLITAERPSETKKMLCRAESFRFSLPKNCDPNEIEAKIENGILAVSVAKLIDKKIAKRIEVSVS